MSKVTATLDLRDVSVSGLDTTSSAAPLHDFWHALHETPAHMGRPSKRRKLDSAPKKGESAERGPYVCIADITIQIRLGTRSAPLDSLDACCYEHDSQPVEVHAHILPQSTSRNIELHLYPTSHSTSSVLWLSCSDDSGDDLDTYLRNVNNLASANRDACPAWIQSSLEVEAKTGIIRVRSTISYQIGEVPTKYYRRLCSSVLAAYCPNQRSNAFSEWKPRDFYDSVHTPNTSATISQGIQHPDVEAQLYPFQRRTVDFMLKREQCQLDKSGQVKEVELVPQPYIMSFEEGVDTAGESYYASSLLRVVMKRTKDVSYLHQHLRGGILAEEVGLGKTVELIDLICLHRRTRDLQTITHDAYTDTDVLISSATLIISPSSIVQQWYNEIKKHAPSLKVVQYLAHDRSRPGIKDTLSRADIVLATYDVLKKEINFADEQPKRNLRHKKVHVAKRSPLVEILWWRTILDEAQMIESGTSNAAVVARRVPRCNAWAVTGTPLKRDAADLMGLLIFLRYEPFAEREIWDMLIHHHRDIFHQIFSTICIRHSKAQVRQELQLPPQKRIVVTVPFSAIEEQHYSTMFRDMCYAVGLRVDGSPLQGDWDPDVAADAMRNWLTRLRQTCLHPEVGERNRLALGRKTGPLRSVEEVLEVLIDQNENSLRSEERFTLMARLSQGHCYTTSKDFLQAVDRYQSARVDAASAVAECRVQLEVEEGSRQSKPPKPKDESKIGSKTDQDGEDDAEQDEDSDKLTTLRRRLRAALELQHICTFFTADTYHSIATSEETRVEDTLERKDAETQEAALYEEAKTIRQEILRDVTVKTTALIERVRDKMAVTTAFSKVPLVDYLGGIESLRFVKSINQLRHFLNEQSELLVTWRQKLLELLTLNLLDQDDTVETDGEEYQETLKQQDEAYVYHFALRAVISDRKELVLGTKNFLMQHETHEAVRLAGEGDGHAPELLIDILGKRNALRSKIDEDLNMRGLANEMRSLVANANQDNKKYSSIRDAEASILQEQLDDLQSVMAQQSKDLNKLDRELDLYRDTESARLAFYRQLQAISDTVQAIPEGPDLELDKKRLEEAAANEVKSMDKLATLRTKRRFLQNLRTTKDSPDESRPCIICRETFESGILTVCAHEFCKNCINIWLATHSSCPICKRRLRLQDLHDIMYRPRGIRAVEEDGNTSPSASGSSPGSIHSVSSIYSSISQEVLNDIRSIELKGSWGSKIDTIARHLIHLRSSGPGNKAVIFSQYRDFLNVFSGALTTFKIGHVRITDKGSIAKFQDDPDVGVLLLDAKSQSSGLNLTNATHVFLCEPLVNVAIELQAIARVHRIGQTKPTTVWQYIVSDSVEEAIYDLSVRRRLQHVSSSGSKSGSASAALSRAQTPGVEDTESKLDVANSRALQTASLNLLADGKMGGEQVAQDDLWHCLFGKVSKQSKDNEITAGVEDVAGRDLRANAASGRRGE